MERIKKCLLTLCVISCCLCLFAYPLVADEFDEDPINDTDMDSDIGDEPIIEDPDPIIVDPDPIYFGYDYTNELTDININLDNLNSKFGLLSVVNDTNDYNFLSVKQVEALYEYWDSYDTIFIARTSSSSIYKILCIWNSNYSDRWYKIDGFGVKEDGTIVDPTSSVNFNNTQMSYIVYKCSNGGINKNLFPCKVDVINNGSGNISVNFTEPYLSTYIFPNNYSVTFTYVNTNNDFIGWYIDGELVSTALSYSINITSDITLEINYESDDPDDPPYNPDNPDDPDIPDNPIIDSSTQFIIIGLLTIYILHDLNKGDLF